ncbi:MAG: hypothetical protein NTV33_08515 [Coprothermobacterota bacterium]|nr:hypothetical protein [Coprothermobacterota bacterium]
MPRNRAGLKPAPTRDPQLAGGDVYEEALRFPGRYPGFIRQAPWLVAFCQEEGVAPFEGILRRRGLPAEMIARWRPQAGLQSVSTAIQNFLLAAHGGRFGW